MGFGYEGSELGFLSMLQSYAKAKQATHPDTWRFKLPLTTNR
jgi:hypothetical protein